MHGVKLPTHPHLVPRLNTAHKSGIIKHSHPEHYEGTKMYTHVMLKTSNT